MLRSKWSGKNSEKFIKRMPQDLKVLRKHIRKSGSFCLYWPNWATLTSLSPAKSFAIQSIKLRSIFCICILWNPSYTESSIVPVERKTSPKFNIMARLPPHSASSFTTPIRTEETINWRVEIFYTEVSKWQRNRFNLMNLTLRSTWLAIQALVETLKLREGLLSKILA